jgi:predicted transcriptional regulator
MQTIIVKPDVSLMQINKERRRDFLSIVADILMISRRGIRKTQIMYKANLSFTQLNEYLTYLQKNELLVKTVMQDREVYVVTRKGTDFLHQHLELTRLLRAGDVPKSDKLTVQRLLLDSAHQ